VTSETPARRRLSAVLREEERVTPLELFFDLVFVLALTQCTALMAAVPTWEGLAQAILIMALLWWSWSGYAWLTSVLDPEEGAVRIVMFVAMAAFLVCALCVPTAFDDNAVLFACAYGVVRLSHIGLFVLASRDDPNLRHSVITLAVSTAISVGLLVVAAATDDFTQGAIWSVAILLDFGGPYFFGAGGWRMMPEHFAERFGLIVIIALGESIVAIGIGAEVGIDAGVVVAAVLGTAVAAALWWLYFDVVAIVATRRLARAEPGREQNTMGRDSYGYLHFPMIAGIVLGAMGLKKTLGDTGDPLKLVPVVALFGGAAVYLLAHVAFRLRNVGSLNRQRLAVAVLLFALIPLGEEIPALASLGVLAGLLAALIAYEAVHFADARDRIRHQLAREAAEAPNLGHR
jgi:low temperature requirement protein LtrA